MLILEKLFKVFSSCKTYDQKESAKKYYALFVKQISSDDSISKTEKEAIIGTAKIIKSIF